MPSLSKAQDQGIQNLDPRVSTSWELVDLNQDRKTYECEFFQSVISEFTDIAGFPVEIYLHNPENVDIMYGESTIAGFDGPYRSKILMENFQEPYMINIMGAFGNNNIQYAEMPKALWLRDVLDQVNKKYDLDFDPEDRLPMPGDVIHCLWNDERYEIASVNSAEKVFMARKHIWSFVLKPYRDGNEGPEEKEMMFESTPSDNDMDERSVTYEMLTNAQQNREKKKLNQMANTLAKKKIEENINPASLDSEYYGYFNGLKK